MMHFALRSLSSRASCCVPRNVKRLVSIRSFSAASSNSSFVFPHSDLSYRALLRNLRLLAGMRRDKKRFNVLVTGVEANAIAAELVATEPALDIQVAGDSLSADFQSIVNKSGADLDSIIIAQPFHTLRNGVEEFKAIRKALCDEEGTLGFIWHRALPTQDLAAAFAESASKLPSRKDLIEGLEGSQSPIDWIQNLEITPHSMTPFKHRKFVETITGPAEKIVRYLPLTHDSRVSLDASSAADIENACKQAAQAASVAASPSAKVSFDFHAFHSAVISLKPKKVRA